MKEPVHTTEAFTSLPDALDLRESEIHADALARLREHAATLFHVGQLLVLVVDPDSGAAFSAYAVPDDTERLRDATIAAEQEAA